MSEQDVTALCASVPVIIACVLTLIIAVLWIAIPFILIGISRRLDKLIVLLTPVPIAQVVQTAPAPLKRATPVNRAAETTRVA